MTTCTLHIDQMSFKYVAILACSWWFIEPTLVPLFIVCLKLFHFQYGVSVDESPISGRIKLPFQPYNTLCIVNFSAGFPLCFAWCQPSCQKESVAQFSWQPCVDKPIIKQINSIFWRFFQYLADFSPTHSSRLPQTFRLPIQVGFLNQWCCTILPGILLALHFSFIDKFHRQIVQNERKQQTHERAYIKGR